VSREEIDQMIAQGLLALVGEGGVAVAAIPAASPAPAPAPVAAAPAAGRSDQQRYKDAYPIATQLTGSLGLRGFRLNLSVEGTANYEQLLALLPKIEAAVGPEKAAALERALRGA
jgi:hypothetical protein